VADTNDTRRSTRRRSRFRPSRRRSSNFTGGVTASLGGPSNRDRAVLDVTTTARSCAHSPGLGGFRWIGAGYVHTGALHLHDNMCRSGTASGVYEKPLVDRPIGAPPTRTRPFLSDSQKQQRMRRCSPDETYESRKQIELDAAIRYDEDGRAAQNTTRSRPRSCRGPQ